MTTSDILAGSRRGSDLVNALALAGICGVLAMALFWQLAFHELPCPLCLLQRVGFVLVGIGILLNLRFGASPLHYGLILFSALAGAFAAGRQILLHIAPGDQGYGSPFLGMHFYTWAFIGFALVMLWTAAMLVLDRRTADTPRIRTHGALVWTVVWLFFALVAANLLSTLLECGLGACADNPVAYLLLGR